MGEFSVVHWLMVFGVMMILFGPKKLPELARSLGESIREFKKCIKGSDSNEIPSKVESASQNKTLP